jgi:RNA polymerase sigma-70 factor (ECF subfamily)
MPSDVELIRECATGDGDALRELTQRYEPLLRRFLGRMLNDAEDVEDALCDVFVRLWRTAPRYRAGCAASTWIYRIAATAATDMLRRRRVATRGQVPLEDTLVVVAPPGDEPERLLLAGEQEEEYRRMARAALEILPPPERTVVTLYYLENLPYREVAEIAGIPVTTVRMRLYTARRRMHRYLEKWLTADETVHLGPEVACAGGLAACVRHTQQ